MNRFGVHGIPSMLKELRPNSKVLGIDFNAWLQHNFSTLEILYQLKLQGSHVYYMQDVPTVLPIYGKPYFGTFGLIKDTELHDAGIERIVLDEEERTTLINESHLLAAVKEISVALNFDDLKRLKLSFFDVGYPIISTIASEFRDSEISPKAMRRRAKWYLYEYARVVNLTNSLIKTYSLDALVVFNGRFVRENAAAEIAKSLGIPTFFHESAEPMTFSVSRHKPHCTKGAFEDFLALSTGLSEDEVISMGTDWYRNRVEGSSVAANRFHKKWVDGTGDSYKALGQKNVTIFPTSDEEFIGLSSEWDLPGGLSQIDWLSAIAQALTHAGIEIVIRLHPNLQKKSKKLRKRWMKLSKLESVKVIKPRSKVNSYELIKNSDLVITCGSTIATEAAYLGVPVLSVGTGIYDQFSIVHSQRVLSEIIQICRGNDLSVLTCGFRNLAKYGFYEESRKVHRTYFLDSRSGLFDEFRMPNKINRLIARLFLIASIIS